METNKFGTSCVYSKLDYIVSVCQASKLDGTMDECGQSVRIYNSHPISIDRNTHAQVDSGADRRPINKNFCASDLKMEQLGLWNYMDKLKGAVMALSSPMLVLRAIP